MSYDPTKPFNKQTLQLIQDTHPKDGPIILERVGRRFAIKKDYNYWKDFEEVRTSDTIGTKAKIHWQKRTFTYAAQDAVAMSWNDLIEDGAVPYETQDTILIQEEDREAIYSIVKSLRDLCLKHQWKVDENRSNPVIISGGETAIVNNVDGFEIGITATGKVKSNEKVYPNPKEEDALLGLRSSGMNSNGFTFASPVIFDKLKLDLDDYLYETTVGEELTKPTPIYVPAINDLLENHREHVHDLINITGGAYTKLKDLTKGLFDIAIKRDHEISPQPVFKFVYEYGKFFDSEMYMNLNCGTGYAALVDSSEKKNCLETLRKHCWSDEIGCVKKGEGLIKIESKFSNRKVIF